MNKGITLIETVLYLTLFSFIMALVLPVLIELDRFQSKQKYLTDALNARMFLNDHVKNIISNASEIVEPELGETSDRLVVRNQDNQLVVLEPQSLFATSTKISNQVFLRTQEFGFEKIEFGVRVNNTNFGTTTYVIYK